MKSGKVVVAWKNSFQVKFRPDQFCALDYCACDISQFRQKFSVQEMMAPSHVAPSDIDPAETEVQNELK